MHHLKKKVFETQTKKKGTLCIGHPGTELCGGGGELSAGQLWAPMTDIVAKPPTKQFGVCVSI